jgi:hypothetical protein
MQERHRRVRSTEKMVVCGLGSTALEHASRGGVCRKRKCKTAFVRKDALQLCCVQLTSSTRKRDTPGSGTALRATFAIEHSMRHLNWTAAQESYQSIVRIGIIIKQSDAHLTCCELASHMLEDSTDP